MSIEGFPFSPVGGSVVESPARDVSTAAQDPAYLRGNYWQFCCCLCPKLFHARISDPILELRDRVSVASPKNTDSYFFQCSSVGIALCDKNGTILDCNPAYLSMTGFSKEELVGFDCLEKVPVVDVTNFKIQNSQVKNALHTEKKYESAITRKNGLILKCEVTLSTIQDLETRESCYMVQLQDLSKVQEAEEHSEHFVSEQEKARVVYERRINHYVRTPIGQIAGLAETLKSKDDSSSEEVHSIHLLTESMVRNLDELLTFPGKDTSKSAASYMIASAQVKKSSEPLSLEVMQKALKGKKVLIVDDSTLNRKMIIRIMNEAGVLYEECTDGDEVPLHLEKEDIEIDLILMDLSMARIGGIEATREIRQQGLDVPIIALTAEGATAKDVCKEVKMNAFCSKPYNKYDIFSKMHQLIIEKQAGWVSDDEP